MFSNRSPLYQAILDGNVAGTSSALQSGETNINAQTAKVRPQLYVCTRIVSICLNICMLYWEIFDVIITCLFVYVALVSTVA